MCKPYSYHNKVNCSIQEGKAQIVWNYWIGVDPSDKTGRRLLVSNIPDLFTNILKRSNDDDLLTLPPLYAELDDAICGIMNRTGVICGECKENFSTAINSYDFVCIPCDDEINFARNIVIYILCAHVPYFILLVIIVLFKLKLISSASSGFILFAQMMSLDVFNITGSSHISIDNFAMHKAYLFVYGLLNFNSLANLLHPFCIWKNFTALDVLCLEYTLAVLPLILMAVLIFLSRCKNIQCVCFSRQYQKCLGGNLPNFLSSNNRSGSFLIHAFAAFILLSYTKLTLISMKILAVRTPFGESDGENSIEPRISLAGHLTFFSKAYFIPYGLTAMLVLALFALFPPLFLLGLPQLVNWLLDKERFSCFRRLWPTVTINIFLDAFQGFYKPNRRPFAGVYYLFRLAILSVYVSTITLNEYLLQQFLITVVIVLLTTLRPYKREVFNIVDIAIFCNLGVINLISMFVYTTALNEGGLDLSASMFYYLQYGLIWLPLIYMLSYLIYKLLVKCGIYQRIKQKVVRCGIYQYIAKKYRGTSHEQQYLTDNSEAGRDWESCDHDSLSDSAMFSRARHTNMFNPPSATSTVQERRLNSIVDEERTSESLAVDTY